MTLHLMIIHHNTQFGGKKLSGSGGISRQNMDTQMDAVIPIYPHLTLQLGGVTKHMTEGDILRAHEFSSGIK